MTTEFAAFVGIDWADQEHAFCLRAAGSSKLEKSAVRQKAEELEKWALGLRDRFGGLLSGGFLTLGPQGRSVRRRNDLPVGLRAPRPPASLAAGRCRDAGIKTLIRSTPPVGQRSSGPLEPAAAASERGLSPGFGIR